MKLLLSSKAINSALALIICLLCGLIVTGQETLQLKEKLKERSSNFCSDNNWSSDDKVSYHDLREMTVAAGSLLDVDAGQNGGISVKGENRSDVLVRACVQAWGNSLDAAKAAVAGIKISTAGGIRAEGSEENYSVSYQILVPRSTDVMLKAHNGGISISSVTGKIEFLTTNGGVNLVDLSGDVRGRTTNGGVNVLLAGKGWSGAGMDVQTANGGVKLAMPEGYAANFEASTVNGGFNSDIASLNVEKDDRGRARTKHIAAPINGGGAPIRVTTTNGGVHISSVAQNY